MASRPEIRMSPPFFSRGCKFVWTSCPTGRAPKTASIRRTRPTDVPAQQQVKTRSVPSCCWHETRGLFHGERRRSSGSGGRSNMRTVVTDTPPRPIACRVEEGGGGPSADVDAPAAFRSVGTNARGPSAIRPRRSILGSHPGAPRHSSMRESDRRLEGANVAANEAAWERPGEALAHKLL